MDQQTQCMGILYVDVCNSVRLYEVLGDAEAHRLIHDCLHALVEITHRHGGTVIRTQGDGVMSVFGTADATYDAATEMQHAHRQGPLTITAGFNFGAVIADEGDVYGDAVNLAARIAALARPGEILLTGETVQSLSSTLRKTLRLFDTTTVRGRRRPVEIYAVQTEADPQSTFVPSAPPRARNNRRPAALTLTHDGGVYRMGDRVQSIVIGRDDRCDLVISSYFASRRHAVIEKRRDRFILTDESSNGTFVVPQQSAEIYLKRESLPLIGRGTISLGAAPGGENAHTVDYAIGAAD